MSATPAPVAHARPFVVDGRGTRTLHFSFDSIQSQMLLDDPDALALAYTRTMMGFLLFVPQPRRICLIGLGGGSLLKYCHRHLPQAHLQVAEVNPHVMALRDEFMVPPPGPRLGLHLVDGARFVRQPQAACEVLLLDGFGPQGMPDGLCSQRFFDDAAGALAKGGMLVVNLHRQDPRLTLLTDRLAHSFGGAHALLVVDDAEGEHRIVFAWRGTDFRRYRPGMLVGPGQALAADFTPILAALQRTG
ncbi:MAG: transferase [Burkholderiales bacterium]|nr:transferase [Burkholderiales bacterium]